jgi:urease accessory protein UreF
MATPRQLSVEEAAEWLGDWHPLAEQLGSTDGLVTLASVSTLLRLRPVRDAKSLRFFLENYHRQILQPLELPAIRAACGHLVRNELRELLAFDRELGAEPLLADFAAPSRRVGQYQLQKLRPLRDQRVVQRYLQAVESGEANGWHTLVYGLTLGIYSLPLRQGLLGYACQTTQGFIYAAAGPLRLSERACSQLLDELCADLPAAVEKLVGEQAAA